MIAGKKGIADVLALNDTQREIILLLKELTVKRVTNAALYNLLKQKGFICDKRTFNRNVRDLVKNGFLNRTPCFENLTTNWVSLSEEV